MKRTAAAALIVSIAVMLFATTTLSPRRLAAPSPQTTASVIAKCDAIGATQCGKKCADDWSITGYHDTRTAASGPEQKGAVGGIVAIQTTALCNRCFIRFTLNRDGAQREVSCEEFFQYLESENSRCGNCIRPVTLPLPGK
ncbi:MAG: hypothetical protein JXA20_09110 [Spirochaetes bacterium]|nr:hypothetical protein [Spirochaetota bacterium]